MVLSQVCDGARRASCPRWACLQVSQAVGRKKVRRINRDGAPGEQRAEFETTGKALSKEGVEGWKVAEGIWEKTLRGGMQGQEPGQQQVLCGALEGDQRGGTKPWRSPAWLVLFWACGMYFCTDFPGSEGSSASFCLWPAACWQTWMQMPHPRRASCVQMAGIKVSKATSPRQHTQPVASSAPLPFPAQGGSQAVRAM